MVWASWARNKRRRCLLACPAYVPTYILHSNSTEGVVSQAGTYWSYRSDKRESRGLPAPVGLRGKTTHDRRVPGLGDPALQPVFSLYFPGYESRTLGLPGHGGSLGSKVVARSARSSKVSNGCLAHPFEDISPISSKVSKASKACMAQI